MAIKYNYEVPTNGLKMFIDYGLGIGDSSYPYHIGLDRRTGQWTGGAWNTSPTLVEWTRNVSQITISAVVYRRDFDFTGYAHHPISMWHIGGLQTAGIILYHFGNWNGNNQDGVLAWYFGDYDGTNGGWSSCWVAGVSHKIQRGEYYHVALQFGDNYMTSWRNGQKVTIDQYRPRLLANSSISGYGQQNWSVYHPDMNPTTYAADIRAGLWYDRKCTDEEIEAQYKYFARRYPLETR
jgi:hypothetical protein